MPHLSIITINYNDSAGLRRTLDSIRSQNIPHLDVVVIDGGSTDGSVEVIRQFGGLVTTWVSEKDDGIYNAQNKGASRATGDFLLFMNSGDWFDHDQVLHAVLPDLTDQHSIYYGDARLHNEKGIYAAKTHPPAISGYYLMKETVCHQSQFIPRKLFLELRGYDESYRVVADYEFFIRAFFGKKINAIYLHRFISVFDTTGVSSNPLTIQTILMERQRARRKNAPRLLRLVYETYASLLGNRALKKTGVTALLGSIKRTLAGS